MKRIILLVISVLTLITTLIGCSSVPSRDEQFYYGDVYFGMSKEDVRTTVTDSLYDEDEKLLTYKGSNAPYSSFGTQTTMYDFKGGELASIMVWYEHTGTQNDIIELLKTSLSNDYGDCTERENTDGTIYYSWKTSLVYISLDYDEVTSRATVLYSRQVF